MHINIIGTDISNRMNRWNSEQSSWMTISFDTLNNLLTSHTKFIYTNFQFYSSVHRIPRLCIYSTNCKLVHNICSSPSIFTIKTHSKFEVTQEKNLTKKKSFDWMLDLSKFITIRTGTSELTLTKPSVPHSNNAEFRFNWNGRTRVLQPIQCFSEWKFKHRTIAAIKPLDWHRQQTKNSDEIRWIFFPHRTK